MEVGEKEREGLPAKGEEEEEEGGDWERKPRAPAVLTICLVSSIEEEGGEEVGEDED